MAQRIETVHILVYSLLLDLAAWFRGTPEPLDERLFPEYALVGLRQIADPRERLGRYVNPELIAVWEPIVEGWVSAGLRYTPNVGVNMTVRIDGLEGKQTPRAMARFTDRSVVELGRQRQYNDREWLLTTWFRPDLKRIENALLRPVTPGGG